MAEQLAQMPAVGGRSNSLGRVGEVVDLVLGDRFRLGELYGCLFDDDAWTRMRAADALEKVCRARPEWPTPYIDRFAADLAESTQPSIQWHLAQIFDQVDLTGDQRAFVTSWLEGLLSTTEVDWIVAANAMTTLTHVTKDGAVPAPRTIALLRVQQEHRSKSVVRRVDRLLSELTASRRE
jgi:hypothetical protein